MIWRYDLNIYIPKNPLDVWTLYEPWALGVDVGRAPWGVKGSKQGFCSHVSLTLSYFQRVVGQFLFQSQISSKGPENTLPNKSRVDVSKRNLWTYYMRYVFPLCAYSYIYVHLKLSDAARLLLWPVGSLSCCLGEELSGACRGIFLMSSC